MTKSRAAPEPQPKRRSLDAVLAELAAEVAPRDAAHGDADQVAVHLSKQYEGNPGKVARDVLDLFQKSVAKIIRSSLVDFAEAARLRETSPEFDEQVNKAICGCLVQNSIVSRRRLSSVRKEVLLISRRAQTASRAVTELRAALAVGDLFSSDLETLQTEAAGFDRLSDAAKRSANDAKDKGGRPGMVAFQVLVKGLARAFEQATGRKAKVTWHEHRGAYEGRFVNLVEVALPIAAWIAASSGRPLEYPANRKARGYYLSQLTRRAAPEGKRRRRPA
jgi:hypothetical protein